ncbi:flavodoxin [Bianquea renquensis]|jgi:flavodoxin|uniref:Flavodoxin n=1 Tax=Bianquea renquensis TaxID=2763661 RepID=A0A926DSM4_9FIRM|nr:flavodoxin [Bianquea renquensis]MBC8543871.1 flavodoxin [Bianquea renquensis]
MKKFAAFSLTLMMVISLAACAGNSEPAETNSPDVESSVVDETSASESSAAESEPGTEASQPDETETEAEGTKVLVAYFSATGTTEGVAEHIANGLNADIYEIVPEEPYTDADLNYNDNNSRTTIEMNDPSARPAISGSVDNMDQYDIVFLGYPIWWGEAPRIVSTFMESYDFSGKTIVPFCTSGGSGVGSSATNLEQLTSGANWLEGRRLNGRDSQDTVMEWVNSLGLSLGE